MRKKDFVLHVTSLVVFDNIYVDKLWKFWFFSPTSGTLDIEIVPYSGELDQTFKKKSNARGFARGGGGRGGGMIAFGVDPDIRDMCARGTVSG